MTEKPRILDNRAAGNTGAFLREVIAPGAEVRAVSAYFSIGAFLGLQDRLDAAADFRFLFGDPSSVAIHDPAADEKPFTVGDDGITPEFALQQKQAARDCAKWLDNDTVQVKTLTKGLLHGKMVIADANGKSAGFCGSSNFTASGLGFASNGGNWELNIIPDEKTRAALREWFDDLWNSDKVKDAKAKVKESLDRLGENKSPEFIYYLTLYRLFRDELDAVRQQESALRLEDSQIWNMLYRFQKDAVSGIIRRLERYGVCILADSVGLGKTYTALAVMKYYKHKYPHILVLCPKRLEQNWEQFRFHRTGNSLEEDGFDYTIQTHTNLGRDNKFAWDKFDFVIIDESHYFRNATGARYKQLREAMQKSKAKVLMLSATPINTSFKDLRNQIWLGAEDDAFTREIGIPSIEQLTSTSQRTFAEWTKDGAQDKDTLIESLGGNFLKLMDAVTVARSRKLIKKHYVAEGDKRLDFPGHDTPQNESPQTDIKGELVYADIHRHIGDFGLSIYSPAEYLRKEDREDKQRGLAGEFTQRDREHFLIGMMRVNFLKRLESSPRAFCKTLERTIDKIRTTEDKIVRYQDKAKDTPPQTIPGIDSPQGVNTADSIPNEKDMEDEEEEEDWTVGKRKIYDFSQLRLGEWLAELKKDRKTLEELLEKAARVVPQRDAKLAKLKEMLRDKIQNPTTNKDGGKNRKALVFTTYTDTARYLYGELESLAAEFGIIIAMVVGGGGNDITEKGGKKEYGDILRRFSPGRQEPGGEEITILIATDCVSEGQNLQDCDYVINYDIHWNPVRIVQRFGRIDRIGSRATKIKMTNFWPAINLNKYLNLKHRVEARMALVSFGGEGATIDGEKAEAKKILELRDKQLRDLYDNNISVDKMDAEGTNVSAFTPADFLAELLAYLQQRGDDFDKAPDGLCAVVKAEPNKGAHAGVIFCLEQKDAPKDNEEQRKHNRWYPYFLVYVREDEGGRVVYSHTSAARSLKLFGDLCRGKKVDDNLCAAFDSEIQGDGGTKKYDAMVKAAIDDIAEKSRASALKDLSKDRGAKLPKAGDYPSKAKDFVLTSWLVIRDAR